MSARQSTTVHRIRQAYSERLVYDATCTAREIAKEALKKYNAECDASDAAYNEVRAAALAVSRSAAAELTLEPSESLKVALQKYEVRLVEYSESLIISAIAREAYLYTYDSACRGPDVPSIIAHRKI